MIQYNQSNGCSMSTMPPNDIYSIWDNVLGNMVFCYNTAHIDDRHIPNECAQNILSIIPSNIYISDMNFYDASLSYFDMGHISDMRSDGTSFAVSDFYDGSIWEMRYFDENKNPMYLPKTVLPDSIELNGSYYRRTLGINEDVKYPILNGDDAHIYINVSLSSIPNPKMYFFYIGSYSENKYVRNFKGDATYMSETGIEYLKGYLFGEDGVVSSKGNTLFGTEQYDINSMNESFAFFIDDKYRVGVSYWENGILQHKYSEETLSDYLCADASSILGKWMDFHIEFKNISKFKKAGCSHKYQISVFLSDVLFVQTSVNIQFGDIDSIASEKQYGRYVFSWGGATDGLKYSKHVNPFWRKMPILNFDVIQASSSSIYMMSNEIFIQNIIGSSSIGNTNQVGLSWNMDGSVSSSFIIDDAVIDAWETAGLLPMERYIFSQFFLNRLSREFSYALSPPATMFLYDDSVSHGIVGGASVHDIGSVLPLFKTQKTHIDDGKYFIFLFVSKNSYIRGTGDIDIPFALRISFAAEDDRDAIRPAFSCTFQERDIYESLCDVDGVVCGDAKIFKTGDDVLSYKKYDIFDMLTVSDAEYYERKYCQWDMYFFEFEVKDADVLLEVHIDVMANGDVKKMMLFIDDFMMLQYKHDEIYVQNSELSAYPMETAFSGKSLHGKIQKLIISTKK